MRKRRDKLFKWVFLSSGAVLAFTGVLLLIVRGPALAAQPGAIRSLALDARGIVLRAATESGLYQSRDGGKTLTPVGLPGA